MQMESLVQSVEGEIGRRGVGKSVDVGRRSDIKKKKRNLLQQQSQVRDLKMDEIVDQGQVDSFCDVSVGDNLIKKMQVSITVKDGIIQSINNNE